MLFRFLSLLSVVILTASTAYAQSPWQHIGVNDGLGQGYVGAILQDSRGFMWFGTSDGLSRYDGYTFKNYRNDPADSASISTGLVTALHECKSGLVWVGFSAGNIDLFDRSTERFVHVREVRWSPTKVPELFSISEDTGGVHWIVRDSGVLRMEQTAPLSPVPPGPMFQVIEHKEFSQPRGSLFQQVVYTDRSGGIWIWSNEQIHLINRSVPKLPVFQRGSGRIRMNGGGMMEDSGGILWFVLVDSSNTYLYSYDPKTGITETVSVHSLGSRFGLGFLCIDQSANIWVIAPTEIIRINRHNTSQRSIVKYPRPTYVITAKIDGGGVLWIGTNGYGIERYDPAVERFGSIPGVPYEDLVRQTVDRIGFPPRQGLRKDQTPYADLYASAVFRDRNGRQWYPCVLTGGDPSGAFSDMVYHDSLAGRINTFPRQKQGKTLSPGTFPMSVNVKMLEDRNGVCWFLGWEILSSYDAERNQFRHFLIKDGALTADSYRPESKDLLITAARKDRDGTFWFGVFREGLFHFDPVTLSLKGFSHNDNDSSSLSNNDVLAIAEDPIEPEKFFWVGTDGGGLNRFEKTTGTCTHFTTRNGLPNNVVYTIFPDTRGRLWMSTNNGLSTLEPRTMTFRYYDIRDGLQGMEFNRLRNYQSPDGRIYLEGTGGMNVFYPETITDNPHVPRVVFTDLRIQGASVSWTDTDSPLKQSITESKQIALPYDKNILTLEFAALDFSNPGRNQFSYQLEGFSDDWTRSSKEHSATFTNLNPGTYTLRVRGSNNDGIWNEAGASLSIIILPPWYRTWWAYTVYVGLFLTVLYFFRQYDLRRIRLKDQLELAHVKAGQLREVDQLKMQFFQNISHEFRTPLTLILGPIEKLLTAAVPEDTQKRELRMMRRNAQRLLRLINQLLDLSRIEAGGMKLQASKGNLVTFLRGMTMSFHSHAERRGTFLDVHSDVEQLEVWFDREKLEKIIINLLSNAFKFTPEQGEVTVTLRISDHTAIGPEGGTRHMAGKSGIALDESVEIRVRDTGIGIAPEKLPHIFNRFYQADSSTTRAQEGTGIGLALVKDLVELHRGTITVTSEPGRGSEFVVSLPLGRTHLQPDEIVDSSVGAGHVLPILEDAETPEEEAVRVASDGTGADNGDENKPILLVIEDNTDVREYIKSYLVPTYIVLEAHDGAEGVERAKESIPDLIISDVMMPEMDGYEVCSRLKQGETTSHIPIILLTAKAAKEDRIGGLETGADDYLIKPFDSTELLVRVKNLIESRKRLREKFGKEIITLKPGEVAVTPVDQVFLKRVMDAVERRIGDEAFGVEELADAVGLSSKQLQRKLKGLANTSANDFIRSFRLQRAMDVLNKNSSTIAEIAYSVGFSSPAYFTKCFQEQFGTTPSEVRKDPKIPLS